MNDILLFLFACGLMIVGFIIGWLYGRVKKVGIMEITDTDTKTNYNLIVTIPIDDLGKYRVVAFTVKHKDPQLKQSL